MRLLGAGIVAVVVGVAAGAGAAWLRAAGTAWAGIRPAESYAVGNRGNGPICVADETSFYFGRMGLHQKGKHSFVFRNTGKAPLRLTAGESTCSCTLSKIERPLLEPGQSTEVVVEWTTKDWAEDYQQSAVILTSDLENPAVKLTITGRAIAAVRPVPREVEFGPISGGETATRQIRLYGYLDTPLEIRGWSVSDPASEKYFDAAWKPLKPPEVAEENLAASGVLATITVKPGLPQGAFLQTITLKTNQETVPQVEVPIHGTVTSDIGIVGRGWDADKGLLIMGVVKASAGAERRLLLIARGPHRQDVRFSVEQTVPKSLQAVLGEPTPIGDGAVIQTPLLVSVPKGARSVNCLGASQGDYGRIRLKTNHPSVPEIMLLVCYSVEAD